MRVLVLNAGSSSLKASVVEVGLDDAGRAGIPVRVGAAVVELGDDASRGRDATAAVTEVLAKLDQGHGFDVVAHRVVHGGPDLSAPTVIDDAVVAAIDALASLAPLHNPVAAAVIRAARRRLPAVSHVAVFDTAFHARLPESERRYPVPREWDGWGIRRYGFHGLSVEWSVDRAAELLGRPTSDLDLVVAHLGNGCSVTAVTGGRSVATSMGMTPLEGLMMGTRAGSLDPGILLAILGEGRLTVAELADVLDHGAGLVAISGVGADMRELVVAAAAGNGRAALAIEMFVGRAAAGIAAAATALTRLDAVVFTGGIGENAGTVRAAIVERLAVLRLPHIASDETGVDRFLGGSAGSPIVLRVAAQEDLVAARSAAATVSATAASGLLT